jgi:simple sugar transport system substrate-binding protein
MSSTTRGFVPKRRRLAIAVTICGTLVLAACGSDKKAAPSTTAPAASGATTAKAPASNGKGPKIFVIGGKSDDAFWSKVKRGVDDAAKAVEANGGSVTWLGPQNYDNLGPDAAKLAETAASQGADVLIGADWVPDAQEETLTKIAKGGKTKVIIYNSGGKEAADKIGALTYIGNEELPAGVAGGKFAGQSGLKNVLCVNTLPGATNTEARCKGIADGLADSGGKSSQLPLPSSSFGDQTAVSQAIKAKLLSDPSIDGVVTISAGDANAAASAIEQGGVAAKVKLGTFDMDQNSLDRIKAGKQLFCIDQQPYLQGYLAVSLAYANKLWGLDLPQKPTLTGPAVISSANVEATLAGVAAGTR